MVWKANKPSKVPLPETRAGAFKRRWFSSRFRWCWLSNLSDAAGVGLWGKHDSDLHVEEGWALLRAVSHLQMSIQALRAAFVVRLITLMCRQDGFPLPYPRIAAQRKQETRVFHQLCGVKRENGPYPYYGEMLRVLFQTVLSWNNRRSFRYRWNM